MGSTLSPEERALQGRIGTARGRAAARVALMAPLFKTGNIASTCDAEGSISTVEHQPTLSDPGAWNRASIALGRRWGAVTDLKPVCTAVKVVSAGPDR